MEQDLEAVQQLKSACAKIKFELAKVIIGQDEVIEQVLVAMGDAHITVLGERLKRKFGAAIVTHTRVRGPRFSIGYRSEMIVGATGP